MKTRHSSARASRSDVSQAGRPPARLLPDAVPKRRHQHKRDCAKYRGSGSVTESSTPAAFPEWGWPAAPRRDHRTIGMSDARSTVLETWQTRVEALRRPVGRDETQSYPRGLGHTQSGVF